MPHLTRQFDQHEEEEEEAVGGCGLRKSLAASAVYVKVLASRLNRSIVVVKCAPTVALAIAVSAHEPPSVGILK